MKKRILCIISSMDTGGAETFIMKLYRGLDKDKHQIDFYVNASGAYDKEILSHGGIIHVGPSRRKHPIKSFFALKNVVKKNKYTTVLKLGDLPLCAVDLMAAKLGGAKVLAMRSCNALTGRTLFQKVLDACFRPLLNNFAKIKIAPSDLAASYTFGRKQIEKGKIVFLHNGLDLDVYKYDCEARARIREELSLENSCVFGHIGRFNMQKNHKFLLIVFSEIKRKMTNAKFLLVGKGELENEIRQEVERLGLTNDVVFCGVRTDVPDLLSAMDVFVFPSFHEGMPNTVIEAQATGLPCVIADTITREANITGLVEYLPLGDAQMWADKALRAVSSERVDTKQAFLENKYDIESTVQHFVKLVFGE